MMHNKKGMEYMMEIAVATILFVIILLTLFVISDNARINVDAKMQANYMEFACNTNLMNLLNFKSEGTTFTKLLQDSYAGTDDIFSNPAKGLLDNSIGEGRWDINVYQFQDSPDLPGEYKPVEYLSSVSGGIAERYDLHETCSTLVPIKCTPNSVPEKCILSIEMEVGYSVK